MKSAALEGCSNAGSNDIQLFAIAPAGLTLVDTIASGGAAPRSITASGSLVYLVMTEAFGGAVGAAAASSCPLGAEGASP
jgi:hypothetical protein